MYRADGDGSELDYGADGGGYAPVDDTLAAAFGGIAFDDLGGAHPALGYGGYAAGGGFMPPMSPRAAGQDAFNAQTAAALGPHAELGFADPQAARWLAGAYGGHFDVERLMAAEQYAEQARPPLSPGYHRRAWQRCIAARLRRRARGAALFAAPARGWCMQQRVARAPSGVWRPARARRLTLRRRLRCLFPSAACTRRSSAAPSRRPAPAATATSVRRVILRTDAAARRPAVGKP